MGITERIQGGINEGTPREMSDEIPQYIPERIPEELPAGMPGEIL